MMQIEEKHLQIIKNILAEYPYTFYAFGSRVKGSAKRLSDLDLCFIENIPWALRGHLEEDFDNSELPYLVDLVDWALCDADFQQIIKKDAVLLQKGDAGLLLQ